MNKLVSIKKSIIQSIRRSTTKVKMNSPAYRTAYLANLKAEAANNAVHLAASNKGANPSAQQYIRNTGQQVLGVPSGTYRGAGTTTRTTTGTSTNKKK